MGAGIALGVSATMGIVQGALGYSAAQDQARALELQSSANRQMNLENAGYADLQAENALSRGKDTISQIRDQGDKVVGQQVTGYAAQGVDVTRGSAAMVAANTRALIEKDVETAKNNSWMEAWGYRVQAKNYRTAAHYGTVAAQHQVKQTLLTGGISALSGLTSAGYKIYDHFSG